MYQALYRKWRPRAFDEVVGQDHITRTLKRQVADRRLSHAYLFTGTRGTGKTTCAKILARAVNCENPQDGNPCNRCPSCLGIENGSILDVLELDAASNNKVDDIRAILEEAVYTPSTVQRRVYIVDEVHMLSTQAFNALLQILEEPPEHLMFILATTELHKVPATIKSRCQQFAFKRIHADKLAGRLSYVAGQEGIDLTDEGAALIARLADGGMRDALSLLDQCAGLDDGAVDEERVLSALGLAGNIETAALLEDAANGDPASALERLARLYAGGKEMSALAGELSALVRDLLVRKTAPKAGAALMTGGFDENTLKRLAGRFDTPRLVQMLNLIQNTSAELARSANRRTDMELCLVTLCDPTLDGSVAGLSARIARLEQGSVPVSRVAEQSPAPQSAPAPKAAPAKAGTIPESGPEKGSALSAQYDAPPWDMEPPKPKQEPRPQPTVEMPASAPEEHSPVPEPAFGLVAQTAGNWPGWSAFRDQLKAMIPVSDFSFLGNPAMTEGGWDGKTLTLWTANDFVRGMLDKVSITRPIAELAQRIMGIPVRVAVQAGRAPEQTVVPAPAAPAQPEEGLDALDAFLAGNQGNIIIE